MSSNNDKQPNEHSVEQMWTVLLSSDSVDRYLDYMTKQKGFPRFSDYIVKLCHKKGAKKDEVICRAGIERSYGHKLFSGTRYPSRDTAIKLAFGLMLEPDETQQLLIIARVAPLHPNIKRDAVIAYCLFNKISLTDTQILLQSKELPVLGEKRNNS